MKKTILCCALLTISVLSFSQTCEEREGKLLEVTGALSAGFVYNTYLAIGGTADNFVSKQYDSSFCKTLLVEQLALVSSIQKTFKETSDKNLVKDEADKLFFADMDKVLNGLKKQAQYFIDYVAIKSTDKMELYDNQRKANWAGISKLLGLDDK
jgi:hypothetical protein